MRPKLTVSRWRTAWSQANRTLISGRSPQVDPTWPPYSWHCWVGGRARHPRALGLTVWWQGCHSVRNTWRRLSWSTTTAHPAAGGELPGTGAAQAAGGVHKEHAARGVGRGHHAARETAMNLADPIVKALQTLVLAIAANRRGCEVARNIPVAADARRRPRSMKPGIRLRVAVPIVLSALGLAAVIAGIPESAPSHPSRPAVTPVLPGPLTTRSGPPPPPPPPACPAGFITCPFPPCPGGPKGCADPPSSE